MNKPAFDTFQVFLSVFILLTIAAIASAEPYPFPDLAGEPDFINFADFAVFAANWQKTGEQLAGDFDDSNTVDLADLAYLSFYWLTERWECERIDLDESGQIDFADFAIFANNWQKSGANLRGDFDCSGKVDLDDLAYLSYYWLTEQWECSKIDIDTSGRIDFADFVKFADCWLSRSNDINYKAECDFDDSNMVDIYDLQAFCDCWLKGATPQDIWEKFKAALWNDDLDKALTFIADSALEKYTAVLTQLRPQFQSMVDGMGDLILDSMDSDRAYYEMLHDEGGGVMASFPVYFSKDEQGGWKIYCF